MAIQANDTNCNARLQIVLDYAERRGWAVFPLRPGDKTPAVKGGFYSGTTNPATLRRYYRYYPYNIGIRTGIASKLFVLDADGDLGARSLAALEAEHGLLPDTLISTTSNGTHFWFACEIPLPGNAGTIAPGIDHRCEGGYAVAPPSVHPDGPAYIWRNDRPLAELPQWLADLARKRLAPAPTPNRKHVSLLPPPNGSVSAYGAAALEQEINDVANAAIGTRNHALNSASFSLHQLVAGGELDAHEVEQQLLQAAKFNGLLDDPSDGIRKVRATIRSGRIAGLQNPRNRQGRV